MKMMIIHGVKSNLLTALRERVKNVKDDFCSMGLNSLFQIAP